MQSKMIHQTALGAGFIPPSPPRPFASSVETNPLPCNSALPDGDVAMVLSSTSPSDTAGVV